MKRGYSIIMAAGTGMLLVTLGQASFGQGAPSQEDIVRALRPVPSALQGGHQGLPTIGAPVRPEANNNYSKVSTAGGAVRSVTKASKEVPPRDQATAAIAVPLGCP